MRIRWMPLAAMLLLAILISVASLLMGGAGIDAHQALQALLGGHDDLAHSVMTEIRIPRLLAGLGVGGVLALAGVLLQALFRNPLADPYVMGVSGGAAVGALFALLLNAEPLTVQSAAIAGAIGAVLLVYLLARDGGNARLLLTGVLIASACGALITVMLALSDSARLRSMIFWLAGDLSWAPNPWLSLGTAVLAAAASAFVARPLNVLAAGELRARSVGLELDLWRRGIFLACAGLTAIAVVSAGTVGFVGLITPHVVRLLLRTTDHRVVAPVSVLLGGTLLAGADLIARTIATPRQLPVGAVMALLGAPVFIAMLRSQR
jgi:iron complex transport system permease protein